MIPGKKTPPIGKKEKIPRAVASKQEKPHGNNEAQNYNNNNNNINNNNINNNK